MLLKIYKLFVKNIKNKPFFFYFSEKFFKLVKICPTGRKIYSRLGYSQIFYFMWSNLISCRCKNEIPHLILMLVRSHWNCKFQRLLSFYDKRRFINQFYLQLKRCFDSSQRPKHYILTVDTSTSRNLHRKQRHLLGDRINISIF